MTEKKFINNRYFRTDHEVKSYDDVDIPFYIITARNGYYLRTFLGGYDYKYNEKAPQYIAVRNIIGDWTLYNNKGDEMMGAKNVQSIEWDKSSYTVEEKGEKRTYSFKEVEKELSRLKLAVFGGIVAISALTSLFCFLQLGKQTKQPASQVQKITDQKKIPPQDTSRGARTE
jgi:hypothetical protein